MCQASFFLLYRLLERLLSNLKGVKKLKINYKFANEDVKIEVDEDWGNILIDLDRQEYNVNHKETRRHTTLDNENEDGEWLSYDPEFDRLLEQKGTVNQVRAAVDQLKPKQRELIYSLYLSDKPLSQAEYAVKSGIEESSVKQNAWRARNALKKFLKTVDLDSLPWPTGEGTKIAPSERGEYDET